MRTHRGFTLIEVGIVVFIIGIILAGLIVPLSKQIEIRQYESVQKQLDEARDVLLGFAAANGYLPCPDTGTNGAENVTGNQCTTITGNVACGRLPHSTLAMSSSSDVWGNRLTYCVNELFARRGSGNLFTLTTAGTDMRVCPTSATCAVSPITAAAVLVLVSHGTNGYGAINVNSGTQNALATHADEMENYDNNDRDIVWRTRTAIGSTAGEYDDAVVWLSRYTLFNRVVASGKLP